MQLIAVGVQDTVVQRLSRQGWKGHRIGGLAPVAWHTLPDVAAVMALPGPYVWIIGDALRRPAPSAIGPDDVVIDLGGGDSVARSIPNRVAIGLQDSPFAVDYGFLLTAGGNPAAVGRAATILDALAPTPKAWLYAGGQGAPAFLSLLTHALGANWMGIAATMASQNFSQGLAPWWAGQRALLAQLAQPARVYLETEQDADYRALPGMASPLPFAAPGGRADDAPARKIAQLLCWLDQQGHAP